MEQNKFEELTSFKEELERYENIIDFSYLQFIMECIVFFDHERGNSDFEYNKLIKDLYVFILKIRQAEINELKAEILTLKEHVDNQKEETIAMLGELKIDMNKCHPEYAIECVDDLISLLNGEY